ncbi:hypothetical protein [Sphingobacterium kitahiroshimense]|uniref:hypothetical protein n=1 Tax=Sphingobacterium kitahiroshimense TaxID=470446 RepID=UPI003207A9E5
MDAVDQKISEIRNLVNHPWRQNTLLSNTIVWNKLCASMDVIADTQMAIRSFFNLPPFSSETGGYLYLYGLLQALFLQQDALNHLSEALFNKLYKWDNQYPDLYAIRNLRNDTTGHPTKRGNDESFHFLARYSVSKGSFRLMSHFAKTNERIFKDIDLSDLRSKQEENVLRILDDVILVMKYEWSKHKSEFMSNKLVNFIPETFSYSISKIYEGIYNDYPLVNVNFNMVKETISKIKLELEKRYGKLSNLSGLWDVLRRIDFILAKLEHWLQSANLKDNYDAEVFLDSLSDRLKELKEMLEEIDREFSE